MARVEIAAPANVDFDRVFDFLAGGDPAAAAAAHDAIFDGLKVLERHPLIGRAVEDGLRELVISRGKSGYVALYLYVESEDVVLVVALRHQREAGFPGRE